MPPTDKTSTSSRDPKRSEGVEERELDLPCRPGTRDSTIRGTGQTGNCWTPLGVVEQIEGFHPELHLVVLSHFECLREIDVPVVDSRVIEQSNRRFPPGSKLRFCEAGDIEPLKTISRSVSNVTTGNTVSQLLS